MWIFGYGSLVWKADFPYVKKVVGYVKGYDRKFWQASIDHRGVPEKPGRVVTLVPTADPDSKVWGTAYEIHDSETSSIEALNSREKRYQQIETTFHPVKKEHEIGDRVSTIDSFTVFVFIGPEDSPLFLGDATIHDMALQIANAEGPSGPNRDYVFKLAEFMRTEFPNIEDSHLFALERAVLNLLSNSQVSESEAGSSSKN